MNPRDQSRIAEFDLHLHPGGGYYREICRSESRVQPDDHSAFLGGLHLAGLLCRAGF
jgi:predicted cupin superfamily sugar epimerase